MGLWFYPRGGSSQVARYLSSALGGAGWDVTLVAGSLGEPGGLTNAVTFFRGIDVRAIDYSAAARAHDRGDDALAQVVPMHASYEDRGHVPDRFLGAVDPAIADHHVDSWARILPADFIQRSDLFHLHHLTPIHEAVRRLRPAAPVLAHLHGTELKFLDGLAHRRQLAVDLGADVSRTASCDPGAGVRERFWERCLREIAARCDRIVVPSPTDRDAAVVLLGVDPAVVDCIPNGIDVDRFRPRRLVEAERLDLLRTWLVDDPRGWDESGVSGSIRYNDADIARLVDAAGRLRPLIVYVGRFTAVKRLPLLLRSFARARPHFVTPAALLVWGGHPGEVEGEHPRRTAAALGVDDVFFVGWRGHDDLPLGLAACDLMVLPSANESFGLSALEAMACGVPVVATRSGGPPSFINTDPARPTGWLIDPDDEVQLADALVEAVNRPDERRRRGQRSLVLARHRFSWTSLASQYDAIYEELRRGVAG